MVSIFFSSLLNTGIFSDDCYFSDQFDKMRSISFDESSLHFAVTFSPGGRHPAISHRLYRLEVDDDNDEVGRCNFSFLVSNVFKNPFILSKSQHLRCEQNSSAQK